MYLMHIQQIVQYNIIQFHTKLSKSKYKSDRERQIVYVHCTYMWNGKLSKQAEQEKEKQNSMKMIKFYFVVVFFLYFFLHF